jgi:hypothetical protein
MQQSLRRRRRRRRRRKFVSWSERPQQDSNLRLCPAPLGRY